MTDAPDPVRLKNVSPFGDVDVPDVGTIVKDGDFIEVTDPQIVENLIVSGHFALADKKATVPETEPTQIPAVEAPAPAVPAETPAPTADEETVK
jgi:hypothetical protein